MKAAIVFQRPSFDFCPVDNDTALDSVLWFGADSVTELDCGNPYGGDCRDECIAVMDLTIVSTVLDFLDFIDASVKIALPRAVRSVS